MFTKLTLVVVLLLQNALVHAGVFKLGQDFQIILGAVLDIKKTLSPSVPVFDLDLYDTPAATIKTLRARGKIVICYFSAGTYEDWRSDASQFSPSDIGNALEDWPGESWLNINSAGVRAIMAKRIQLAAQKGCHAIDPDNTDVGQNDNGLGITSDDVVDYLKFLAKTATANGLEIGLKNTVSLLPQVASLMSFAVNEACQEYNECNLYKAFLLSGKPVFHIEYPANAPTTVADKDKKRYCKDYTYTPRMSTVLKTWDLNGWVMYCDNRKALSFTTTASKAAEQAGESTTCTVAKGARCGGKGYSGCTICDSGTSCVKQNEFISMCR